MSASTSGALKALIEGAGLGISAFRDRPVDEQPLPYVTIHEEIVLVPDPGANDDPAGTGKETAQVDLWQQWRDPTTRALTESYSLPRSLHAVLKGAALPTAPDLTYDVKVRSRLRLLERDDNVVHHAYTLEIVRQF